MSADLVPDRLPTPEVPAKRKVIRQETFAEARGRLSALERLNIAFVRRTFESPLLNGILRTCQRLVGSFWVHHCTKNIRIDVGLARLPAFSDRPNAIMVSNHRSFFDMFVINAVLYRHGFIERLLFPVRANFFYDHPLGFLVNGIMSFWSMYPPIFRDRKRLSLNHASFNELSTAIREHRRSAGIHPEGTRNRGDDPYSFLPAQGGVGRLIYTADTPVIPIFINGLGNNLVRQVAGNFTKKGRKVLVVFGAPIDFGDLFAEPANAKTYKRIADRCLEAIAALGEEERALRAELDRPGDPAS